MFFQWIVSNIFLKFPLSVKVLQTRDISQWLLTQFSSFHVIVLCVLRHTIFCTVEPFFDTDTLD